MATRRKGETKTNTKKSEPIEIGTITDASISSNDIQQKSRENPLSFPVVGIGASAGGLKAIEEFFSGLSAEKTTKMSFFVVQHLAPDYKSILAEIVRRYTKLQVLEVTDGMAVKPRCVYIIPPNRNMAILNGTLHLFEITSSRGHNMAIDFFFHSLAKDQHERAIGIILSGTGSDGTLGLKYIKGEGGVVFAQIPVTAEYDGMPFSAIATGLVDYQLPPIEMAKQLITYVNRTFGNISNLRTLSSTPPMENAINKILILLRSQTGHDFSQYKRSTINRRIDRRMVVHKIEQLDSYIKYLQQTPEEAELLFRDLLIGVTTFFRDKDAFQALEKMAIPMVFADKSEDADIRIWCPGCSTGEEAYSIAILFMERMTELNQRIKVQIFATDIDDLAIKKAREGLFPVGIASTISPERLQRFFTLEEGKKGYRVNRSIRDLILFSIQNVISDPPFSNLDLVSCRNLMIYMNANLQKMILSLFHYALNPLGILFLGVSETTSESDDLFSVLNIKAKLYQQKESQYNKRSTHFDRYIPPNISPKNAQIDILPKRITEKMSSPPKLTYKEITEQALLQNVMLTGALVNSKGDIFYMHGRTGIYLELRPGDISIPNIVHMAREGLQSKLSTAIKKAAMTKEVVYYPGLQVKTNGHFTPVNLSIYSVKTGNKERNDTLLEDFLFLVVLEVATKKKSEDIVSLTASNDLPLEVDARIVSLIKDLKDKVESLQTSNEELESSTEELKASNEEMQAMNEELQSANEELETSKEELQSLNEELLTVNTEMQTNVIELTRSSNDMKNLLSSTNIGIIFVDYQQRIMRYTPTASVIINLIESDVGRPLQHVASNFVSYNRLSADVKSVLDTLVLKEIEVMTKTNQWYLMRILPYRTMENMIEGAVITFVDITEMKKLNVDITKLKKVQSELKESQKQFIKLFLEAPLGIALLDSLTGHIYEANPMFAKIAGLTMAEISHIDWMSITHKDEIRKDLDNMALLNSGKIKSFQMEKNINHRDGTSIWINMTIANMLSEDKTHPRYLCIIEDISQRKRTEETMLQTNQLERLALVVRDSYDAITVQDLEGRIIAWNPSAVRMYGWSEAEALSMNASIRIVKSRLREETAVMQRLSISEGIKTYKTIRLAKDGTEVVIRMTVNALINENGQMYAIATTERKVKEIPNQTEEVQNG